MAQLYSSGPAHILVNRIIGITGSGSKTRNLQYLGTCEEKPEITEIKAFSPIMNQIGGDTMPFDEAYQGTEVVINLMLTRYNRLVAMGLKDHFTVSQGGLDVHGSIGSLVLTEDCTFETWIWYPYAQKTAYSATLINGYKFQSCHLMDNVKELPGATSLDLSMIIKAMRLYNPTNGAMLTYSFLTPNEVQIVKGLIN